MDPQMSSRALDRNLKPARAVAAAMVGSTFLYIAVAWVVVDRLLTEPLMALPATAILAIAVLQLPVLLASFLAARAVRAQAAARAAAVPGMGEEPTFLPRAYARSVIVAFALREVPVVVGLTLSLLTADLTWVVLLGFAGLAAMAADWPRRDAAENWLREQGRFG